MHLLFSVLNLLNLINRKNLFFLFSMVIISVFSSFVEISLLTTLGILVTKFTSSVQSNSNILGYLSDNTSINIDYHNLIIIFTLLAILLGVSRISLLYINNKIAFSFGKILGNRLINSYLTSNYQSIRSINSAEFISVVANKVNNIIYEIIIPFFNISSSIIIFISLIIFTFFVVPFKIIIYVGIFGLIYYLILFISKNKIGNNSKTISKLSTDKIKILNELYGHIKEIYLGMMWTEKISLYYKVEVKLKNLQLYELMVGHSPKFLVESLMFLLFAYLLYTTNGDAITFIAVLVVVLQRLLPLVQQCHSSYISILNSSFLVKEITDILSNAQSYELRLNVVPMKFNKKIDVVNLGFKYNERTPLFNNLNFTINKGSWVGIIGQSGAGKSTLIDIIMGLVLPNEGLIYIDGLQLDHINLMAWRKNISHVPQSPYLSDSTLIENITLSGDTTTIDLQLLNKALYCSCLEEFVNSLPNKLLSSLGENGSELSGGQRQRLAIARALYSDRELIVFDESTNALDAYNESLILGRIKEYFKDKTVIFISHKAMELKYCNIIYNLSNGQLLKKDLPINYE